MPPPPGRGGPDIRVIAGGAIAVLILAAGGYAFATIGSDGESEASRNPGSAQETTGGDRANSSEEEEAANTDGPGDNSQVQGDRALGTGRTEEPDQAEGAPNTSQSQPEGLVSGYIAQLGSFTDRAGATARLTKLQSRGVADGVLWSSDYSQMAPGYWVVYAGPFGSKALADGAAESSGIRDAFSREISPR